MMEITPRCRMALNYAHESLSRFGHSHVSCAHLVLGLLMLQSGVPYNVLRRFGMSIESVEGFLAAQRRSTEETMSYRGAPLGRSAMLALERAEAEAHARHHTYLGIEHLLLGILAEVSGEAADLFASVHVERDKIRQMIVEEIDPVV